MPNDNLLVSGQVTASISLQLRTSRAVRDSLVAQVGAVLLSPGIYCAVQDWLLALDRLRARFSLTLLTGEDLLLLRLEESQVIFLMLCRVGR